MGEMFRKTFAEINLNALMNNWKIIQNHFPQRFVCPMVKANAYGHGDVVLTRHLQNWGVRQVGVCLIEEGLLLRKNKINIDILVFRGFDKEGAREIVARKMTPVVSSWDQLEYLNEVTESGIDIHLKFDTGMNRLGFQVKEAQKLSDYFDTHKKFQLKAILTHLSQGEDAHSIHGDSFKQLEKMRIAHSYFLKWNPILHTLNSAAILNSIQLSEQPNHFLQNYQWGLRPGLMMYGYNSLSAQVHQGLQPVMNLKSLIGDLRSIQKGEGVSYNSTWRALRDSVIAVVPIGYADGFHRLLSNRGQALVGGERVNIVGNICMDYLMLDVTELDSKMNLHKDQAVTLLGSDESGNTISAYELAHHTSTIPWEILTSVGERVPRTYIGETSGVIVEK